LTARLRGRSVIHLAIAALTIIAAVGAALVIFASPRASGPVTAVGLPLPLSSPATISFAGPKVVWVAEANHGLVLTLPRAQGSGVEIHTVGSILLILGIVGTIVSMLFLLWSFRARPSRLRS
jgi:hypothetical protein